MSVRNLLGLFAIITLTIGLSSCSVAPKTKDRGLASDICKDRYFVDQNSHFDNYEECHDK